MEKKKSVGLYIHIPFCAQKCRYCDFPSFSGMEGIFFDYTEAVCREMEMAREEYGAIWVDTIFFGGGTPSLIPETQIVKMMHTLSKLFSIEENAEITIEANPGTLTLEKARAYQYLGFNRISIGLQAIQDRLLRYMGRIHTRDMFFKSIELVKNCGFHNINADILFGIPTQTMEEWLETMGAVMECDITHVSCYSLKIEENTPWHEMQESGALPAVDEDLERDMVHRTTSVLDRFGFSQYEISNYAKPGYESRHNLKYWTRAPYLGIGAAAHSLMENKRTANRIDPVEYIKKLKEGISPKGMCHTIEKEERLSERLILGLRLLNGVSLNELIDEFGYQAVDKHQDKMQELINRKLLCMEGDRIRLTKPGLDFANQVWVEFI